MFKIKIFVTLKDSILDPAGVATKDALQNLGFLGVTEVQIGKIIEITAERGEDIEAKVSEMCQKLLVNTVMEDYRYEIEEIS